MSGFLGVLELFCFWHVSTPSSPIASHKGMDKCIFHLCPYLLVDTDEDVSFGWCPWTFVQAVACSAGLSGLKGARRASSLKGLCCLIPCLWVPMVPPHGYVPPWYPCQVSLKGRQRDMYHHFEVGSLL